MARKQFESDKQKVTFFTKKTKIIFRTITLFSLFLLSLGSISAQKSSKGGAVCSDAAKPECTEDDEIFKPYSLVFKLSQRAVIAEQLDV